MPVVVDHSTLQALARELRVRIIEMLVHARSGHPGGSLSAIDMLVALYFGGVLRHDPAQPYREDRDRFLLSKGHCIPALYAVLAKAGYFPEEELLTLRRLGSRLQGHPYFHQAPDAEIVPGLEASTGSLGQGLSIAVGFALGARVAGRDVRVYCMVGDGECQTGQLWEAAMAAPKLGRPHYVLDNLTVLVDRNRIQNDDFVDNTLPLEPLLDKWASFGWAVREIQDGHDIGQILEGLDWARRVEGQPALLVAHTVKGKGVSFMEDNPRWHGVAPNPFEGIQAIREILGVSEAAWDGYLAAHPAIATTVGRIAALQKK